MHFRRPHGKRAPKPRLYCLLIVRFTQCIYTGTYMYIYVCMYMYIHTRKYIFIGSTLLSIAVPVHQEVADCTQAVDYVDTTTCTQEDS